jgi:sulfur carrier protein
MHKRQRVTLGRRAGRGDNAGMDIVLNGEPRSLDTALTVLQLLQREGLADRRVAVELNGDIVPRSRHGEHALAPGDRVEIVHALGGG